MDIQENKEKNFIYIEREELFAAYDLYQNRISLKLAEIMVYKGEKTRELGIRKMQAEKCLHFSRDYAILVII